MAINQPSSEPSPLDKVEQRLENAAQETGGKAPNADAIQTAYRRSLRNLQKQFDDQTQGSAFERASQNLAQRRDKCLSELAKLDAQQGEASRGVSQGVLRNTIFQSTGGSKEGPKRVPVPQDPSKLADAFKPTTPELPKDVGNAPEP